MHSDQLKPKSYLKLNKKRIFRRWTVSFNLNPIPGVCVCVGGALRSPFFFFVFSCVGFLFFLWLCHGQTPQDIQLIVGDFSLLFIAHISAKKKKKSGSGQVRLPERVCWPHLRKVCNHVRARDFSRGDFLFSGIHFSINMCNLYISESVTWGQVRDVTFTLQAYWKGHVSDLSKWAKNTQFFQDYVKLSYL